MGKALSGELSCTGTGLAKVYGNTTVHVHHLNFQIFSMGNNFMFAYLAKKMIQKGGPLLK